MKYFTLGITFFFINLIIILVAFYYINLTKLIEKEIDYLALYVAQIKIKGYAKIISSLFPEPIVHYTLEKDDVKKITRSIEVFCKILLDSGAQKIFLPYNGKYIIKSLNELKNFISDFNYKKMNFNCAHMMSSCKMSNNSDGIVNDKGFLKNHPNIMVADNSILPESIGESPQLTTMAFVHQLLKKQLN